ncbi:MAG: hypothetical protein IT243_00550 [Bacteroidia bacterium]|nr:hypothetical protein [Bacteroidia bacterium]
MLYRFLFIINIFLIVSGCKEDPAQPVLKFYEGKGTLGIGQSGYFYTHKDSTPVKIKFIKITEDSRCPEGGNCIWAGQVIAEIIIDDNTIKQISQSDKPLVVNKKQIYMGNVIPYRKINEIINPKDYKIELDVVQ